MTACYHCGLPAKTNIQREIDGQLLAFCCIGCEAVTQAIMDGGLENFYQYRDEHNGKADAEHNDFEAYDLEVVQADFVSVVSVSALSDSYSSETVSSTDSTSPAATDIYDAQLYISNISCAACAWLIENYLLKFPGVLAVSVNVASHQCRVRWDKSQCKLSEVFLQLKNIGYQATPASPNSYALERKKSAKAALLRLGLAGIGMMQVGMLAIALHAGGVQGMSAHWQSYLRWASLIISTPVMLYSAMPFYLSAWRALRLRHANMDVPVSLALVLAFTASIWATVSGNGQVYFDSVSMFVFFLLLGRYLEMRARHASASQSEDLSSLIPKTVEKLIPDGRKVVPLSAVNLDDHLWVAAGAVFPCDGVVLEGRCAVDESVLTGESLPVNKTQGDTLMGGTLNGDSAVSMCVTATGEQTRLSAIKKILERAMQEKPHYLTLADKLASRFVLVVLGVALLTAAGWFYYAPERALWVSLSVLVVTCPCALSLASPAALTAGISRLGKLGLLVSSAQFLERLSAVNHIVFDKTGTLTTGDLCIAKLRCLGKLDQEQVLAIVAALEVQSEHPIARAFHSVVYTKAATSVVVEPGLGVRGLIDQKNYRFGRADFASEHSVLDYPGAGLWQLLADDQGPIAWVLLQDRLRDSVKPLFGQLQAAGMQITLLSGDRRENVEAMGWSLGLANSIAEALPQDKLQYIQQLQRRGDKVLMVGDGINDVPVLSAADVSIAMGAATQLAKTHADGVLLSNNLMMIVAALQLAHKVNVKIKQNFAWAFFYNLCALPLAVIGWVPPYAAAIGMSLSSIVVVLNALALRSTRLTALAKVR
ncbi:MAG: copper-transporting ATPase [Alteromonadaceae bacterium]|nr:MAG: copper-transporting ATPase [Alteromonadaceae bacterium]